VSAMSPGKPPTREEDAFGHMLLAYHNGREVFDIIERDDEYIDAMSAQGYFAAYEEWRPIEQDAMKFVNGSVLDVGCGAGRHAVYLQTKGFDVLGIDISPRAIQVCQQRGLRKATVMPIENVNFASNSFDTILMMGNNFGLLGNRTKARKLLRAFHKMTTANAVIIAETRDPYQTDNPVHREYHAFNESRGRMGGQLRLRNRFEQYVGRWFDYLMVSKEEMRAILGGTGWKVKQFLESADAQYVAIIEKAA
jgi:SAM-dependent methyltransferase